MGLNLIITQQGSIGDFTKDVRRGMENSIGRTMATVKNLALQGGRAAIASGGFGPRWQNTYRAKSFPANGRSLNAAVFLWHKIPYANIFQKGGQISGKPFLWLPLPTLPRGVNIRNFKTKMGGAKLFSLRRPGGGVPLLGAQTSLPMRSKRSKLRTSDIKGAGGGKIVPVFFGVNAVTLRKRFDTGPAVAAAAAHIEALYRVNIASEVS